MRQALPRVPEAGEAAAAGAAWPGRDAADPRAVEPGGAEVYPAAPRKRSRVERLFAKVRQSRRAATRYDKKAVNFLAFVHIASIMILLR